MNIENTFKFEYCANHYDGCNNKPTVKLEFKEYCIDCYTTLQYRELTYAIKYGKYKNSFKIIHNPRGLPQLSAFENRKISAKNK